jgi:hypothetical protein
LNRRIDAYAATALFGLALVSAALLLYVASILIANPASLVYIVPFALPAVIGGVAVFYVRPWGLVVGILVGAFGTLAFLEDAGFYLSSPLSFFDFVPTLFGLAGAVILLAASLAGTVQHLRHRVSEASAPPRTAFIMSAAILGVVAFASAAGTALSVDSVAAAEARDAVVITADNAKWDVKLIERSPGQPTTILVRNNDPVSHTFTVYDLDINERIGPWSEKLFEIPTRDERIFGYICRISAHKKDMTGAIIVK